MKQVAPSIVPDGTDLLALLATLRDLPAQVEALRRENVQLREDNARLREDYAQAREDNARLREDYARAREDNARLRAQNAQLSEDNERLRIQVAELQHLLFGQKSEKLRVTPVAQDVQARKNPMPADAPENTANEQQTRPPPSAEEREARRKARAARRARRLGALPVVEKVIYFEEPPACEVCQCMAWRPLGEGEVSYLVEHVPEHLIRYKIVREKLACRCGMCAITAPAPLRVSEGSHYGAGLYAHVLVAKCADAIPLHRQTKQLTRSGVSLERSTLGDLFHRAADLLRLLWRELLAIVAADEHVNADETPIKVQAPGECRRAYVWVFVGQKALAYVYSASRSSQTPEDVLGHTTGVLQVDAYSGYNQVCVPNSRIRAGCWSHVRRRFFAARGYNEAAANDALNQICDLYLVEDKAALGNYLGTDKHLALRDRESAPVIEQFHNWLTTTQPQYAPKSPIGKAIKHALKQWSTLIVFLKDAHVYLDNNISERSLRSIAVGRKNFLFLGNDLAGEHLAIVQTLVATCEMHGVNPYAYLRDILIRVQITPQSRIQELLPQNWRPPPEKEKLFIFPPS